MIFPLFTFAALAAWLWLWKFLGEHTWAWGKVTFWALLAIGALLCTVNATAHATTRASRAIVITVLVIGCGYLALHQVEVIRSGFGPPWAERLWDVSQGAYDFNLALKRGENPYRTRAQYHPVDSTLGYSRDADGGDRLFGWRYYYGYPHFPMSALWFAPFIGITGGYNDIRAGNLLYYVLSFMLLNAILFVGCERRWLACLTGSVAFLGVDFMVTETFQLGIVDQAFAVAPLAAMLAAMFGRWNLAGALAGLALASKHFPAIPVVVALSIYVYRSGHLRRFVLCAAAAAAIVVLPFLLWDAEAFVSATILHHIHEMRFGDDTALYFFVPEAWKPAFRLFGFVGIGAVYAWGLSVMKRPDMRIVFLIAALTCLLINAFYPVTHLNHLESILVFAATSFAFGLGRNVAGSR